MWMADKPIVQEQLSSRLASVITKTLLNDHESIKKYIRAFWQIISLEWDGIDRYRIDKYYLLLRKIVNNIFHYMELNGWNPDIMDVVDIIQETILNLEENSPDGLRIFIYQIWIEEGCKDRSKIPSEAIKRILRPLFEFISIYNNKHISSKADRELYEAVINSQLDKKVISDIYFEYGSNPKTLNHQRKLFYDHYKQILDIHLSCQ